MTAKAITQRKMPDPNLFAFKLVQAITGEPAGPSGKTPAIILGRKKAV